MTYASHTVNVKSFADIYYFCLVYLFMAEIIYLFTFFKNLMLWLSSKEHSQQSLGRRNRLMPIHSGVTIIYISHFRNKEMNIYCTTMHTVILETKRLP